MITTKVVLKDKFWILQKDGASVGTMRIEPDHVSVTLDGIAHRFVDINEASKSLEINEASTNIAVSGQLEDVYGYPTDLEHVFNVQKDAGLPCYTKSKNSKVIHAAGWYGMMRNALHAEAFCPKINTLRSYPYIGPFRSQMDLRLAMTSWKRNDQTESVPAGPVFSENQRC